MSLPPATRQAQGGAAVPVSDNDSPPTVLPAAYINTHPGQPCLFSPPPGVSSYNDWIKLRYAGSLGPAGRYSHGVAQRVHAMLEQQRRYALQVMAFGPHAGAAAMALQEITRGALVVEVLA